ncbi:RHS repeat domain-containing protein [Dyella psychrodurans]|nr:RHS repeat-associated core domain-containing protein [Dyella psychrodurans]
MTKFFMLLCLFVVGQSAFAQTSGTVTYVYTDPQGTPLAEADASGNITATFDYTPYGTTALGTPPNGPGYTGHVNDPETNLVYMQARYYDPATGRFLGVDPKSLEAGGIFGLSRYAYASNNPILFIDPDGRNPCETDCAARLRMADAAVSSDARMIVHLFAGPFAGLADLVHGIVTSDHHEAAEGAAMTIVSTAAPEGEAAGEIVNIAKEVEELSGEAGPISKIFSSQKQSLVDMAKMDKRLGITSEDMQAYKDLNAELPDPFPANKVRGPEAHSSGAPSSRAPHGHVGPVDHIPVRETTGPQSLPQLSSS